MRFLAACLLVLASAAGICAGTPSLQSARKRWLHGNYEEARELYEHLARDPALRAPAVVGVSRAWQSQGEYDKALAVVDAALVDLPKQDLLLARRAELLYLRGRALEAEQAAGLALQAQPGNFLARWIRAQAYADRGDVGRADSELRWFVRTYTERSEKDNDIKDPDELLLVGLAGSDNARWHHLSDQYRAVLTDVYVDAIHSDKDFWPAEYQAGLLLLEKFNRGEALGAFDKALAINPHAAEVYAAKGKAALDKFEVSDAEQFAQRALQINPSFSRALRLRADIRLLAGDITSARRDLETARRVNPHDESTLGKLAACMLLLGEERSLASLTREVRQRDTKPSAFYHELAGSLEARRRFDDAEKFYQQAIEFRPQLAASRNNLGLLYMRMGREAEAKETLLKAFEADEFNVLVSNTLKVLRHLETYETLKTAHFEIRFKSESDGRLVRYMLPYLEEIHAQLSASFGYQPSHPILIEIFNNHEKFSGRITSLPDLHTVGACTGRVMAMVSPHGEGIPKPFNWLRVVRHELVHMFNLEETHFLVPHWFTEGLAVSFEGFPRPVQWNQLLLERVPAGELMSLDDIEQGFIKPRSPLDWHMAYCQSQLYVQYLRERHGEKTVGEMLQAFRDGLDTPAALSKVCHESKDAVESGYRAYLDKVVKSLEPHGRPKHQSFLDLQKAHESAPENLDAAARLAEQYWMRHDRKEARRLAEAVLSKEAKNQLAAFVKARLLLDGGEEDQARTLLEQALDRSDPEPKVLQLLGKLYYESHAYPKAAEVFELGRKTQPYETRWLNELARVYSAAGNQERHIKVLEQLVLTDADDYAQRKRLARMLMEAKRFSEAEKYARQVLEIDIRDAEARDMLEQALVAQDKTEAAADLRKALKE
jgi:tetratricopeptide (TPR) repeat protein